MAATPSLRVVKTINWRGGVRQWSNRYHFNGGTPADAAHWTTLASNVGISEKAIYGPAVSIVEYIGYAAGSEVPVWSSSVSTAGTLSQTGIVYTPSECCALLRWNTAARSSKNHPIYLFNYFHGCETSGGVDAQVATAQKTAIDAFANAWIAGFSDGTLTLVRAGPNGATATGHLAESYPTHRDFPK
jgi:hypothetical protein